MIHFGKTYTQYNTVTMHHTRDDSVLICKLVKRCLFTQIDLMSTIICFDNCVRVCIFGIFSYRTRFNQYFYTNTYTTYTNGVWSSLCGCLWFLYKSLICISMCVRLELFLYAVIHLPINLLLYYFVLVLNL